MLKWTRVLVIAAAIACSAVAAHAQINPGHLTGTVKDAQGAVLPGVTVTATSPALLGAQSVVSEAGGEYRFPSLPAGTYTLTFELGGFQTMRRDNIVLATGQTLNVDITLQLATLSESITVTGQSPVVDKQATAVGYVQTTAQLTGVPTSTDLWGALAQTPGVRMQGVDVGGSHKSQQSGYEAFGVVNQARVITDGVDTTEGSGGAGFYQDFFAQNEIAVSAAGQDVSMNTPGAAIISSIKSGGNQFAGLENLAYEPGSFVGNNIDDAAAARGYTGQPNLKFYEGHLELGGPVLKDKLWFYAAYNHFKIDKQVSGVPVSLATDLGLFNNFTTKESYKLGQKDTLIGYYQWGRKEKPLRGIGVTTPRESALAQRSPSWAYNGRWQRTWSNRVFSEVNVGEFGYTFPEQPNVPYTTNPPRHDNATGFDTGAGWLNAAGANPGTGPFVLARGKPQVFGNLTYFLPTSHGTHDFKFGFEFMNDRSTNTANGTSGPILYFDVNGKPSQVRITDFGDPATFGSAWTQASDYDRHYTAYGQDRFAVTDRVTLTYGLRYDHQRPYYSSAVRQPTITDIWLPTTVPGGSLLTADNIAPRLGVGWDVSGDSRSVVKAFYGRFYFNFADNLAGADPAGPNYKDITFNDLNGNGVYDGLQELGRTASGALDVKNSFGGAGTVVDPNLKNSYTDEFDLSYDRQFWGESAFRVAFVRKIEKNLYTTINTARIGAYTVPTSVTVNIQNFGTGVVGPQTFTLFDIPSSLKGVVTNTITNIPDSLGGSSWTYDTVELAFNKRFRTGLFLNASYDYQWRKDLRQAANNSGAPSPSNSNLNSDPIAVVGAAGSMYFAQVFPAVAPLQRTSTWDAHVSARYEFKYAIGAAVNYSGQSGWPYARVITATLPNAGNVAFFSSDLSNQRNDNIHLLAFRVDKGFTFNRVKITGMFDLFNILNTNAVTNFNVVNGSKFNQINATVDPRTAQVGIRVSF
jgi:Carboxypeptidase regulatory-like domain/TonB dependent receptor